MPGAKKQPDPNQHVHLCFLETLTETITDSLPYPTSDLGLAEPEELLGSQADRKVCSASGGFHPRFALGKPVYSTA